MNQLNVEEVYIYKTSGTSASVMFKHTIFPEETKGSKIQSVQD
jgi:hypothetical protein